MCYFCYILSLNKVHGLDSFTFYIFVNKLKPKKGVVGKSITNSYYLSKAWQKQASLQIQSLTSRGNVEAARRVFGNVDWAGMLSVNVRNRRIFNIPDYDRIPVCVQESSAFRVATQNQRGTTLSSWQSRPCVFCGQGNISSDHDMYHRQNYPNKIYIYVSTSLHLL